MTIWFDAISLAAGVPVAPDHRPAHRSARRAPAKARRAGRARRFAQDILTDIGGADGAAMELACLITDGAGVTTFCQVGFGADAAPAGWLTALKLPSQAPGANTNCFDPAGAVGDGAGGPADCHDNSIHYEWCVQIPGDDVYTIDLRLGSDAGGFVFTEKSTFYIDSTKLRENDCVQRFPPSPDPGGAG